jgi:hypothetical protein
MIGRSESHRQRKCFQSSYLKFVTPIIKPAHTCTDHTVPYGTALWGGVIPGTSCQATISLSLRDKRHSPIEDSHEVSVYASSPRGLAASQWAPRTEEQNTGETPKRQENWSQALCLFSALRAPYGEAPSEPGLRAWLRPTTSPPQFSLRLFDHFTAPEQRVSSFQVTHFCLTMPMAAQSRSTRTNDLMG